MPTRFRFLRYTRRGGLSSPLKLAGLPHLGRRDSYAA